VPIFFRIYIRIGVLGGRRGVEWFFNIEERQVMVVTYCSGARRASVAVCGSLKERLSLLNGTWVSPGVVWYIRYA